MIAYRPDIDGLRALAVIAVVLNHAHVPGFGGGFAGVDVFFVISGTLITQILLREKAPLGTRLWRFYERRIRRIVPALAVTLAVSAAAATLLLSPYELVLFAKSLLASVAMGANLFFETRTDYFNQTVEQPLLHLWSLGVEEQFYLLYPLLLWALTRYALRLRRLAITAIMVASLALSQWLALTHARHAFFFTGARGWELMLGAMTVFYSMPAVSRPLREGLALLGLGLILVPIILFNAQMTWPGLNALVPCAGAALLIGLHRQNTTMVAKMLGSRPFVAVGLISYSLYLWHWPIFEFYRRWVLRDPTAAEFAALIAMAAVIAALSWRFVEQPFRRGFGRTAVFSASSAVALMLSLYGAGALAARGWPERFPAASAKALSYLGQSSTATYRKRFRFGSCFVGAKGETFDQKTCFAPITGRRNILLWGDSHAMHHYAGFEAQARKTDDNLMQATFHGCIPALGNHAAPKDCSGFNRAIFSALDRRIDFVILSTRLTFRRQSQKALRDMAQSIAQKGIGVIVLGPALEFHELEPLYVERHAATGDDTYLDSRAVLRPDQGAQNAEMQRLFSGIPGVVYVSVRDTVCKAGRCPMTAGGAPTQYDTAHLTLEGSMLFGERLWPKITSAMAMLESRKISSPPPGR